MRLVDRDDIRRSLEPTQVPLCVKCGTSMWTIQIEDFADQGRRTYECPECLYNTTIITGGPVNMRERAEVGAG